MIGEHYLVSRYAPGQDLEETWTGIADIGSKFLGQELTENEYLSAENRYLYAYSEFMRECGVTLLNVVEPSVGKYTPERWLKLSDGDRVSSEDALDLLRSMLREDLDAKLEVPDTFYVHVGYDMITYVGTPRPVPDAVDDARRVGLYVDPGFRSPYLPDPADV